MSSILDNLAQQGQNDWLSQKLDDNPEEDQALQTTARIATAHIWPFLAAAISDDDYRNRRGVKEDQVRYICATIGPHVASALVDHVLGGFDRDYALMRHQAQEEGLAVEELLPWLSGGGKGEGEDNDDDDKGPGMASTPDIEHMSHVSSLVHQAPGGGVHGPYNIEKKDGGYDVVNALGESKGHHDTKGEAREQQKALYVNIPEAREQAEEQHEGSLRVAQGDPYGHMTLLPGGKKEDEGEGEDEEEGDEDEAPEPFKQMEHHFKGPGAGETPGTDPQYGDPTAYYGQWGAGGQANQKAAAAGREAHLGIVIDRYGHIRFGAYDRSRDPQLEENDDPDPDRYWADQEAGNPENDVYHGHDEPEYEADWEEGHDYGHPRTSARGEEKGTVPCPICHKKFEPDELAEHMRTVHHVSEGDEKDEEYKNRVPGRAKPGQGKAKPSAGRQTHKPSRGQSKSTTREGQLARSPEKPPRRHWRPAAYEMGYDPSEAFPGYYGAAEGPQRSRTAQAPLAGQADVPGVGSAGSAPTTPNVATPPVSVPESTTGASGMFNPGAGGGDFSQSDAPQDIQAQLGQLPTLSHKIGAKLAEMAAEAISYNPGLSALAAMELSLQVLRLYPKVAAGGSDYMAEPGTEGVPTEVLTDCPQCQWQAYNREINRCHNCGFYDAGLEPSIEVT